MTGLIAFTCCILGWALIVAMVCCIDTLTDWYHTYQDKQHIDLQKELLQTAWRKLDIEREQLNAQQALHHEAIHALNTLLEQQTSEQLEQREHEREREREQCKLHHPSNQH